MNQNEPQQVIKQEETTEQITESNTKEDIQPKEQQKQEPKVPESDESEAKHQPKHQLQENNVEDTLGQIQNQLRRFDSDTVKTVQSQLIYKNEENAEETLKIEPIKTEEFSVQVGGNKNNEVLKNIQETYAPQSCTIFKPSSKKKIESEKPNNEDGAQNNENGQDENNRFEVQVQVGVSLLVEPQKIIGKAKQQRILSDHENFSKFLEDQKVLSQNQKSVYLHVYQSVQKKKNIIRELQDLLKNHFDKYSSIMRRFSEKSIRPVQQEQKVEQLNRFLNIGQEMKEGYAELKKFKQTSGQSFIGMSEYINGKTLKDLQAVYHTYLLEMQRAQAQVNQKRKACLKIQQQFQKQGAKVQRMFNRTKQGKSKQQDDFFVQISKAILRQKQFRQTLLEWGRQIINLRKELINNHQKYCHQIQQIFNEFKSQSNLLESIQKFKKYTIRKSRKQIEEDVAISNLIILVDSDYIRYAIQSSLKKEVGDITDQVFESFVELPHFKSLIGQPKDLLVNMKVKVFSLKDVTQELVNTVSGNLVLYNKDTLQYTERMLVKNIKSAITMQKGQIEIEQNIPGIIFDSKKTVKLQFKDADRAEELVCFLGQGQTSNN